MFKSIRWSLQAWHAAILAIVLVVYGYVVSHLQRETTFQQIDDELHRTAEIVTAGMGRPFPPWFRGRGAPRPTPERAATDDGRSPPKVADPEDRSKADAPTPGKMEPDGRGREQAQGIAASDRPRERPESKLELSEELLRLFDGETEARFYFIIWRGSDRVLHRSQFAPDVPLPDVQPSRDGPPVRMERQRGEFREAIQQARFGTNILVGRSINNDLAALQKSQGALFVAGIAVLAAGMLGGWWFSGRAIKPIEAISATAAQISVSNLSQRIDVTGTQSELSGLAETLNHMFDRLETAFAQQVRFTADASHELRTPLAVILTHSELALAKSRSAEELRETIDTCRRSALRMKALVESLLTLARFDSGELRLECRSFDVTQTVNECARLVRPLADQRRVSIHVDGPSTRINGDAERLAQVVTNLLTNAIRYNRDGGRIDVAVRGENGAVIVTVADTGVGIPPEHLPHVFDRFYRADKSRSHKDGGAGLGLAICKSIVDAHGGEISASSREGGGTTLELRLPSERHRGDGE